MPSLSIRKLEDETLQRLRVRAAHHQVSMEEEVRRILRQAAVMPPEKSGSLAKAYFGEEGIELGLPEREVYEPISFGE